MSLSTSGPAPLQRAREQNPDWSAEEIARLRAFMAEGPARGRVRALAVEMGRSFSATCLKLSWVRKHDRRAAAVAAGQTVREMKRRASQAGVHQARFVAATADAVRRRCVACRAMFDAPSRFRFRCDPCLKLHAAWTGYDA